MQCKNGHERTAENLNKDRACKLCKRAAQNQRSAERKAQGLLAYDPEIKRRANLKHVGWTVEEYEEALRTQNGKCANAGCGVTLTFEKSNMSNTRACADHAHAVPKKARGILCNRCNRILGLLEKYGEEVFTELLVYLRKHSK